MLTCVFSLNGFSQFIVKPDSYMETYDVSNDGDVVGYTDWGGPYFIWYPETGNVDSIYGLAPGNGIGSHAMFSNDGLFLSGTTEGPDGPVMARYDRAGDTWSVLGSLGWSIDGTWSGGYSISGDGSTVVGNSWADTTGGYAYSHAIAWNQEEGIMDLGTMYFGRSTRANDVSGDGSVVVGWQDYNGPWKSAVWRKDPNGGYFPNEYILIDPQGDPTDEYNQAGECTAISADGNWIGGAGDFANNGNPWIWSETTGFIDLGTLAPGGMGYVAALNNDGTLAVGRIQQGPWDPELAFVWTPQGGIEDLNEYAQTTLGLDLGNNVIYSANCMSPDGSYIAGYGIDTVTFDFIAYRMSMETLDVHETAEHYFNVYPNPATNVITVDCLGNATITITSPSGQIIEQIETTGKQQIDISAYADGIYFVTAQSESNNHLKTMRLVKQ